MTAEYVKCSGCKNLRHETDEYEIYKGVRRKTCLKCKEKRCLKRKEKPKKTNILDAMEKLPPELINEISEWINPTSYYLKELQEKQKNLPIWYPFKGQPGICLADNTLFTITRQNSFKYGAQYAHKMMQNYMLYGDKMISRNYYNERKMGLKFPHRKVFIDSQYRRNSLLLRYARSVNFYIIPDKKNKILCTYQDMKNYGHHTRKVYT
jgi:hypothetical protein